MDNVRGSNSKLVKNGPDAKIKKTQQPGQNWASTDKNVKQLDLVLSQIEFAYNWSKHQSIGKSPFEVVYGLQLIGALDLLSQATSKQCFSDDELRAKEIQKLHENVRKVIEKKNLKYKEHANHHRKHAKFKFRDLVWIHLRKNRFPQHKHGKLKPRADGLFKVIEKIGKNAYKLELLARYDILSTFNVKDLRLYLENENKVDFEKQKRKKKDSFFC